MSNSQKPKPEISQIKDWLSEYHHSVITGLAPLSGGYWSSAYAYSVAEKELVLRLGESGEGFNIDKQAMAFANCDLPVPKVLATGTALGLAFAISERHYGQFIETQPIEHADNVGLALNRFLMAMRALPSTDDHANWYDTKNPVISWNDWLLGGITDSEDAHTGGWRATLAATPEYEQVFQQCETAIHRLLPLCPGRGELIHGDLLHQNVLVNDDASEVTAVFSWKCSARGDFLYDVAWLTLWQSWFPAIANSNIWQHTLSATDLSEADLENAALRHHCYELQIAASHMAWYTWTEDEENMLKLVSVIKDTLARGPNEITIKI